MENKEEFKKTTFIKENFVLAQRLKERREELNLLQVDVAKKLGVTSSVISNYERAYRDPSTHMLKRLAFLYGTSSAYLLGTTNIKEPLPIEPSLDKF